MVERVGQRMRIEINDDMIQDKARLVAFALVSNFIAEQSIFSEALGNMRPAKLQVLLIIALATVQKMMRQEIPEELHGLRKLKEREFGYISRRAIAGSSGLPRENVRRIVNELIAEKRIVEGPNGALRNERGLLASASTMAALPKLARQLANTSQRLFDIGVFELSQLPE